MGLTLVMWEWTQVWPSQSGPAPKVRHQLLRRRGKLTSAAANCFVEPKTVNLFPLQLGRSNSKRQAARQRHSSPYNLETRLLHPP